MEDMCSYIETKLLNLGGSPRRKGYAYTVRALEILMTGTMISSLHKELYCLIAKESGATVLNIERNIRGFVECLWEEGDHASLCEIFGKRYETFRPSNKEFLFLASRRFLIQMHTPI